jgi:peptide chain release factor
MMTTWVQISSGRGPAECGWVVAQVANRLHAEAKKKKVEIEWIEHIAGDRTGTFRSTLLSLSGNDAYALAESWSGTIQWVGQSPYRPNHMRKNWFVSVDVFSPPSTLEFDERAVRFEYSRASGPGGQHVNCTDTAVRAIHEPTGVAVQVSNERSQHFNRQLAIAKLFKKLEIRENTKRAKERGERWSQHNTLERGNPSRIYEGRQFKRRS